MSIQRAAVNAVVEVMAVYSENYTKHTVFVSIIQSFFCHNS